MRHREVFRQCQEYFSLCKPKVVLVMLATAWVGMFLSCSTSIPWFDFCLATFGIALAAGSAAVINHLVDAKIDAKMQRTAHRPLAKGLISRFNALLFSLTIGILGVGILFTLNPLAAILTFITMGGYAVLYSMYLKHASPQNIVIGGIAGAMPPLLGWSAIQGEIHAYALLLVLIIFAWTPPHFWALALFRHKEYQNAGVPMLPVTHGIPFTKLSIVLYSILLFITTLLPYLTGMFGLIYLFCAILLGLIFLTHSIILYFGTPERHAMRLFSFSIFYLLLLFSAMLIDHLL